MPCCSGPPKLAGAFRWNSERRRCCPHGSPPVNQAVREFEETVAWGGKRKSSRTYGADVSPARFLFACSKPGSILSASSKSLRAFSNLRSFTYASPRLFSAHTSVG